MVTRLTNYTKQFWILLSTDDMDTLGAHNGDEAIVIDQDKRYVFDEDYQTWHQIPMSGGGGGGSDNRFVVTLTIREDFSGGTMDKTPAEIDDAWTAGKSIWLKLGESIAPLATRTEESNGNSYAARVIRVHDNGEIAISTSPNDSTFSAAFYQLTPLGS